MNKHGAANKQRRQREQQRLNLRRKLRAHRDSLTTEQLQQAEADLFTQLQSCWTSLTTTLSPTTTSQDSSSTHHLKIAGYLATGGEISLASSLQWLRQQNHLTYLPVVKQQQLMFAKLDSETRFTTGKYNIDIPVYNEDTLIAATQLDVVLLPLVGFDLQGGRIGMGGGYYDRTFEFLLKNKSETNSPGSSTGPLMLGIAHEFQRQQKIPVEDWDVPIAAAITDQANHSML